MELSKGTYTVLIVLFSLMTPLGIIATGTFLVESRFVVVSGSNTLVLAQQLSLMSLSRRVE